MKRSNKTKLILVVALGLLSLSPLEVVAQEDILRQLEIETSSEHLEIEVINEKKATEKFAIRRCQSIQTSQGLAIHSWRGKSITNYNRDIYIANSKETLTATITDGARRYSCRSSDQWINQSPSSHTSTTCQISGSSTQKKVKHKSATQQDLVIYRLALTATSGFSALHGNTVPDVAMALLNYTNQVNTIYEREVGIRLELVDDIDKLIYLDSHEDPFSDQIDLAVNQNIVILNDSIGIDHYDIGHLLRSGGGGLANVEVACTASKGFGVSGFESVSTFPNLLAHEIGHQLGAGHTWNSCNSTLNQTQRSPSAAMEPGSGNTIMSYAGLCGNNNVTTTREDYFHTISIDQIRTYTRTGMGLTCAQRIVGTNTPPIITDVLPTEKSIPKATPFILSGYAVDMEDNHLTYTWDQIDQSNPTNLGDQTLYNPIIRSKPPAIANHRYIPAIRSIASDIQDPAELLPNIARALEFRFLVRDNNPSNAQISGSSFSLNVDADAGPFMIENPGPDIWHARGKHPVHWDVANTDNAAVDCQAVHILIDYDGSLTFQDTLAHQVSNDGLHYVDIIDTTSSTARIMITAADNIFFDITEPFEINRSTQPGFQIYTDTTTIVVCDPDTVAFTIQSKALNGFANTIRYSAPSLPAGLTATFQNNDMPPGTEVIVQIMISPDAERISHVIEVDAFAANGIKQTIPFLLDIEQTTLTDPMLVRPESGSVTPSSDLRFEWSHDSESEVHILEISSNPDFAPEHIIIKDSTSQSTISQSITNPGVYFWRISSKNNCNAIAHSASSVFGIKSNTCTDHSNIADEIISDGIDSVSSSITVHEDISIESISINHIHGTHSYIGDLTFVLESPDGSRFQLLSQECNEGKDFDFGIHPEGERLRCSIDRGLAYRPSDSFASLIGTSAQGDWTLKVIDNVPGDGGQLTGWTLSICTWDNPSHPELITADTLKLKPNDIGIIGNDILSHIDNDNPSSELKYIITAAVTNGFIVLASDTLGLGDTFSQAHIDDGILTFHHDNIIEESDQLTYVITDGQGYVSAPNILTIEISNGVSNPTLPESFGITLFPNPVSQRLYIDVAYDRQFPIQARLHHIDGRLIGLHTYSNSGSTDYMDVSQYPEGIYVLSLVSGIDFGSQRIILQR